MTGPARRGQRVALVEDRPTEAQAVALYVCGARPLDFGEMVLTEGVEVPGAADWPRVQAWVDARRIRMLRVGEEYTTFEDFRAAWEQEHLPVEEPGAPEQTGDTPAEGTSTEE